MIAAGVDVGSTQSKAVLLDGDRRILARALVRTGANIVLAAQRAFRAALEEAGLEEGAVDYVVGTGYGRYKVTFGHAQVTEISCHGRGASFIFPGTRTILDIGGQDTKAIRVDTRGEVTDFCMNDKCAAGTGRFLESAAQVLGLGLEEIGAVSLGASRHLRITNVCTVFVQSEIMNHLAWGRSREDILRGVHLAIARRSGSLLRRVGLEPGIAFTGGVSLNVGMRRALEEVLEVELQSSEESHYMGAIGAALHAWERVAAGVEPVARAAS